MNETAKRESFRAYRAGWRDGSIARTKDARYLTHPSRPDLTRQYERGYQAARDASNLACAKEAERLHYDPRMEILRSDPRTEQAPELLGLPAPLAENPKTS